MCSQRTPKTRSETVAGDMAGAGYRIVRNNSCVGCRLSAVRCLLAQAWRRSQRRRPTASSTMGSVASASSRSQGSLPLRSPADGLSLRALLRGVDFGSGAAGPGFAGFGFGLALGFAVLREWRLRFALDPVATAAARRCSAARPGALNGSALRDSASSACDVTQTGVWELERE